MLRDPLYKDIVTGLRGPLNPEAFEHCAVDLLRPAWPRLVPIRGGGDAGMDGACADGDGPAFPLVCTTGNVLRNLKGSLHSYLKHGGTRRRVIVATSRQLTPLRRRNLEAAALTLGFT